jgi:hypothetical protein
MTPRRLWLFGILVVLVGCRDTATPTDAGTVVADLSGSPSASLHILQQALAAPLLETYQVSFWAHRDQVSTIAVNYQPAVGEAAGLPFLRFDIPQGGLRAGPGGLRLGWTDSVFITLSIDPESFTVAFEPSGVVFSRRHPATLAFWYGNANPDLNGDGVVDPVDQALAEQLAIWGRPARPALWHRTLSQAETEQQWVWTALYHFSEYAVSW